MNNYKLSREFSNIIDEYVKMIRGELVERYKAWKLDLSKIEMYEVIGALMARQVSLATNLALSQSIWNGHIAPLILRTMVDTYIVLAWIFQEPLDRARKFISFGLGQEKLFVEHLKSGLKGKKGEALKEQVEYIEYKESWINSQRFTFLTEVNVGAWSGLDARKMAEEAGCKDIYVYAFLPFSACVHSMWHHICRYNLENCKNPLHRYHRLPVDPILHSEIDYLYRATKYADNTFKLFDNKTKVKVKIPSSFARLTRELDRLGKKYTKHQQKKKK